MITLDQNFRIEKDTYSLVLIQKVEYDKIDKKTKEKTGEKGIKELKTYYPNLALALKSYLVDNERLLIEYGSLEEIIKNQKNIELKINSLKNIYNI